MGSKVVFCDLATSNGAQVCKDLGENVTFVPANVTDSNEIKGVIQEIERLHGQLNVVVNCAGLMYSNNAYNFTSNSAAFLSRFNDVLQVG